MQENFSIMRKLAGREVLRFTAKISMGLSILSIVFLALIISFYGSDEKGYSEIIVALWRTNDNLLLSVLIVGSMLIIIVAIMTWIICLYSSFRLAGPIYRLQQQLGLASNDNSTQLTRLRNQDSLLLKMSYRSARESIRVSRIVEKDISNKIKNLLKHMESDEFDQANCLISDINVQLLKIKI